MKRKIDILLSYLNKNYKYFFLIENDKNYESKLEEIIKDLLVLDKNTLNKITVMTKKYVKKLMTENKIYVVNKFINYNFNESDSYKVYLQNLKLLEQFLVNEKISLSVREYLNLLDNNKLEKSVWYLYYASDLSYTFEKKFVTNLFNAYAIKKGLNEGLNAKEIYPIDTYLTYVDDITNYPLLTKEEEDELLKRAKSGDKFARDYFLKCNLRLVVSMARNLSSKKVYVDLMDLIEEGNIGLITAYNKFNINKNTKFSTYAHYWILQSMTTFIYRHSNVIVYPKDFAFYLRKIRTTSYEYIKMYDRLPTIEELSEETNLSIEKIKEINSLDHKYLSLENPLIPDFDIKYEDLLISNIDVEDEVSKKVLSSEMKTFLEGYVLNDLKTDILIHRFGFYDGKLQTFSEIANKYGRTRQSIDLIEKAFLNELRQNENIEGFSQYMDYPEKAMQNLQKLKETYSEKRMKKIEKTKERQRKNK